jgi:hypothetical protein
MAIAGEQNQDDAAQDDAALVPRSAGKPLGAFTFGFTAGLALCVLFLPASPDRQPRADISDPIESSIRPVDAPDEASPPWRI